LLGKLSLMLLTVTLMSCSSLTNSLGETKPTDPVITEVRGSFCEVARPICESPNDTTETRIQVRIHNLKGKNLDCPDWTPDRCIKPIIIMSPTVP
jgi:hypothetical protein